MKSILKNKYIRTPLLIFTLFSIANLFMAMNTFSAINTDDVSVEPEYTYSGEISLAPMQDSIHIINNYEGEEDIFLAQVREVAILNNEINLYDVSNKSNLTLGQLDAVIKETLNSVGHDNSLIGLTAEALYKMEQDYNVNALFALSVASLESGWGSSYAAIHKNNLFGMYCGTSSTTSFSSIDENIDAFGKLIRNSYIDKGLTNTSSIGSKYCTTPTWHIHVNSIMSKYQRTADNLYNLNIT